MFVAATPASHTSTIHDDTYRAESNCNLVELSVGKGIDLTVW